MAWILPRPFPFAVLDSSDESSTTPSFMLMTRNSSPRCANRKARSSLNGLPLTSFPFLIVGPGPSRSHDALQTKYLVPSTRYQVLRTKYLVPHGCHSLRSISSDNPWICVASRMKRPHAAPLGYRTPHCIRDVAEVANLVPEIMHQHPNSFAHCVCADNAIRTMYSACPAQRPAASSAHT